MIATPAQLRPRPPTRPTLEPGAICRVRKPGHVLHRCTAEVWSVRDDGGVLARVWHRGEPYAHTFQAGELVPTSAATDEKVTRRS